MIGIYKVVFKPNNKTVYIGQSTDIDRRIKAHWRGDNSVIDKVIHQNPCDYLFEVVEECEVFELEEKEIHYIKLFNTMYPSGYNMYLGTPIGYNSIGENNIKTCLRENDVLTIRNRCQNELPNLVWQDYKNLISYDAFQKIIKGETWTHLPVLSYLTETRSDRHRAKLTEKDVREIRKRAESGETIHSINMDFSYVTPITLRRIINYQTWKNIDTPENHEFKNGKFPASKATIDDVVNIRKRYDSGESINSIHKDYNFLSESSVRNIAKRKTWRNIK